MAPLHCEFETVIWDILVDSDISDADSLAHLKRLLADWPSGRLLPRAPGPTVVPAHSVVPPEDGVPYGPALPFTPGHVTLLHATVPGDKVP